MNKVVHFEIPADDMERAQKFYRETFGWSINEIPRMNYCLVNTVETDEKGMPKTPGAINGGMVKRDETGKHPVIVIKVPSIEEHIKKVEKTGGKIVMPTVPVGDMGFYARFRDTEGNIIGLWQDRK